MGRDRRLETIDDCAAGRVPVTIALMNLASQTARPAEVGELIRRSLESKKPESAAHRRLRSLEELARSHPNAREIARRLTETFTPRPEGMGEAEYWAAEFDRAVAVSSEASVALYSFGDPLLLRTITEELVGKLVLWGAVRPHARVLDYGCGIGRVTQQLAAHAREVVGVDISMGMLREARARLCNLANVELRHAQALLADKTVTRFDLILLVDVCPYLADATPLLAELSSRLTPGASLIVMNWSYGLRPAQQRARARSFARQHELVVVQAGTSEFDLWDGLVFHFRKPSPHEVVRAR